MRKLIAALVIGIVSCVSAVSYTACELISINSGHEHTYVEEVVDATCTEKGLKTFTCSGCGHSKVEELAALGHDLNEGIVTEQPTCTTSGIRLTDCKRCGEEVSEEVVALGHDYSVVLKDIPATCTDGEKTEMKCSRCEETKNVAKEGSEKLGHDYEEVDGTKTEATCTESGSVAYQCARCDDLYDDIIPALGHVDDKSKAEITEPTCQNEGYTVYHCGRCDQDYKTDYLKAIAHEYEKGESLEASCSTVGVDNYPCKYGCGKAEHKNIVANIAHKFENGVCTECGNAADKAFALIAEKATYINLSESGVYTIYSESYESSVFYIPYNVLTELQAQGIYAFEAYLGGTLGTEGRTIELKINNGTGVVFDTAANELKAFTEYVFATQDGINEDIGEEGLKLSVYYRAKNYVDEQSGKDKVDDFSIKFAWIRTFNQEDPRSYIVTSADYEYDKMNGTFTLSDINLGNATKVFVRPEWIKSYAEDGYDQIQFGVTGKPDQMLALGFVVQSGNNVLVNVPIANIKLNTSPLTITDEMLTGGLLVHLFIVDLYGTAWAPACPLDGALFTVEWIRSFDMEDPRSYIVTSAGYEYDETSSTFALSNINLGGATKIFVRPEWVKNYADKGCEHIKFGVSSKPGQMLALGFVVQTASTVLINIPAASIKLSTELIEITEEMISEGLTIHIFTVDLYGTDSNPDNPADGVLFTIEFKTFGTADWVETVNGSATVTYDENNGWTVDRAEDAAQIVYEISNTVIQKAIAEGNDTLTIVLDLSDVTSFVPYTTLHTVTAIDANGNGVYIHNDVAWKAVGIDSSVWTWTITLDLTKYNFETSGIRIALSAGDYSSGAAATQSRITSITFSDNK